MLRVFSLKKIAFVLYFKKNDYFAALFGGTNVLEALKVPLNRTFTIVKTL